MISGTLEVVSCESEVLATLFSETLCILLIMIRERNQRLLLLQLLYSWVYPCCTLTALDAGACA